MKSTPAYRPDRTFTIPVFGGRVWLYTSRTRYQAACKRAGLTPTQECVGVTDVVSHGKTGAQGYIVGVFNGRAATLVHESAHVAMLILNHKGIDARQDHGETFAYLIGYIVDQMGICSPKFRARMRAIPPL